MKHKPWDVPAHLRDRRNDLAKLQDKQTALEKEVAVLKLDREYLRSMLSQHRAHIEDQQKRIRDMQDYVLNYRALRQKEVVVFDGEAKYLTGETLDEYCKTILLPDIIGRSMNELWMDMQNKLNGGTSGSNTGSESEEADQKSFGDITSVLRYANGLRFW